MRKRRRGKKRRRKKRTKKRHEERKTRLDEGKLKRMDLDISQGICCTEIVTMDDSKAKGMKKQRFMVSKR